MEIKGRIAIPNHDDLYKVAEAGGSEYDVDRVHLCLHLTKIHRQLDLVVTMAVTLTFLAAGILGVLFSIAGKVSLPPMQP